MTFTTGIGQFSFEVKGIGDRSKESSLPQVSELTMVDHVRAVKLGYNYTTNLMSATFLPNEEIKDNNLQIDKLKQQLVELKNRKADEKDLDIIDTINEKVKTIEAQIRALGSTVEEKEFSLSFDMPEQCDVDGSLLIPELVRQFAKYAKQATTGDEHSERFKKEESDKNFLNGKSPLINAMATDLEHLLSFVHVEYIYAHSTSQQVLYNIKDSNDFLSKTIHEYYMSRISPGDAEHSFVLKWMDVFDIGHSFEIKDIEGEAYQVKITDTDNDVELADKGMGAIQMMILLLRLATLIRRYKKATTPVMVLVEEPEQNLHPAFQSLLADLFLEVNLEHGFCFIVETHSEYLIRRSQAIVATSYGTKELIIDNPFVTYYMPKNGIPYSMSYTEKGRFEEKFGEGFFDEAGKSNLILIKKERGLL